MSRSIKKGPFVAHHLLKKISKMNETGKKETIKTWSRASMIIPDMVGHTGSLEATIKAVEAVDACTKAVVEALQKHQGIAIVLADHGNAEKMINDAMREILKNRTTIIITHRLSNLIDADKILFLQNGIAKKIGTHEELIKNFDPYRQIFSVYQELPPIEEGEK